MKQDYVNNVNYVCKIMILQGFFRGLCALSKCTI